MLFSSTKAWKWHLWNFRSFIFLPLQWNYLRWLRQRRHFIWWWSTPAAVSQRVFTHACFTHAHCGFTHAVNRSRISPSDQFPNVGVRLRFKQGAGVDGGSKTAAYVWLCVSRTSAVMRAFCSKGSPRICTKDPQGLDKTTQFSPKKLWNVFKQTHCHEGRIIGHVWNGSFEWKDSFTSI